MALYQVSSGDRILAADLNQFYSILKGVAASGESVSLIYNAAGALILQPSSDPAVGTQLYQLKNNAGTVKAAITAGGGALFSSQVLLAQSSTISSSGTTDLSTATGNYAQISGTTTITAFGTVQAGTLMVLEFQGALTLTHNATSLILRAGANATTAAGDIYAFVSEGSGNWREIWHLTSANATTVEDHVGAVHITEDFLSGEDGAQNTIAYIKGAMRWLYTGAGGGTGFGPASSIASVANHPGILRLDTSANTTAFVALESLNVSGSGTSLIPADFFDLTFIIRPSSAVDANFLFRFGLTDATALTSLLASPANGIYIEKVTADTTYFGVTRSGASQTRTAAFGTVTNGTWTKFRIRRIDASTIGFTQDSSAEVQATLTIPTAALLLLIQVASNNASVSKLLDVDLVDVKMSSITR